MITINLYQFPGLSPVQLEKHITGMNESRFRIIIERPFPFMQMEDRHRNWIEYGIAAYTGQLLCDVAEEFGYLVPSLYKKTPFQFDVKINDEEKFIAILFELLCFYNQNFPHDNVESFNRLSDKYIVQAEDHEIVSDTYGLIRAGSFAYED